MAAGKAIQATPVQITHVFMLCCITQIMHVQSLFLQESYYTMHINS